MAVYITVDAGYHNSFRTVRFAMHVRSKVLVLLAALAAFSLCEVLCSFHYGNDFIVYSDREDGSIPEDYLQDKKLRVAKRFYNDFSMNMSDTIVKRVKRYEDATFVGHTKTREERWHSNFNMNKTFLQVEQAQSLVNLLVKVMDKYLNACVPIILYDHYVESSEGIVLEMFFKVSIFFIFYCEKRNSFPFGLIGHQNLLPTRHDK